MRTPYLLLALLFTAAALPAQQPQYAGLTITPLYVGCPVGFTAERTATPATRFAAEGSKPNAPRVLITFTPRSTSSIVKARITAYGVPPGPHLTPAGITPVRDITEIFQLERKNGEPGLTSSSLTARTMSGIRSVALTEIEYADGTKWQSSPTQQCRATPNGLLLVAASR